MKSIILTLFASAGILASQVDDRLGFVFQITRHGARAPLSKVDPHKFKVTEGMLTA